MATCWNRRRRPETGAAVGLLACLSMLALLHPATAQQSSVWINPDYAGDAPGVSPGFVVGGGGLLGGGSPGPQRYRLPFNRPDNAVRLTPPGTRAPGAPVVRPPAAPATTIAARPVAPVLVQPLVTPRPAAPVLSAPRAAPRVVSPAVPAPVAAAPAMTAAPAPTAPQTAPQIIRPTPPKAPPAVTPPAPARVAAPAPAPEPPPRQVATAAPAATAALAANVTRVLFADQADELDAAGKAAVREIAARLQGTNDRVGVKAFADSATETQDWKRRLSLRRGQNVRRALLDEGVQSFRIVLRALGPPNDGGPGNRVDLSIESR